MDTDLVVRVQRGDKAAYAILATEIADRYLAVARRILRDLDLAEDATQQALLAIPWTTVADEQEVAGIVRAP